MLIHGPMLHPADILIGLLVLPCNARTVIQGSIYGKERVCNYSLPFSTKDQKNHSLVRAVAQPTVVSEGVLLTITKKNSKNMLIRNFLKYNKSRCQHLFLVNKWASILALLFTF